jgi:cytochrome c1
MRATVAAAVQLGVGAALAALPACRSRTPSVPVPGGSASRGAEAIVAYACGACHTIDGVTGAHGLVGPPLTGIADRTMIAGQLPNTPENMIRWISDPQAVEPGTAMPNLHVPPQIARDLAAYLYTLRD